jgi:geranylgeranyl pyrophosphate synthase
MTFNGVMQFNVPQKSSTVIWLSIKQVVSCFRLAVGLMQAFATQNKDVDLAPLVNDLAICFQIRDDFINLADEEYMKSKYFREDLTKGKFSFPIILAVRRDPNDTKVLSILKQHAEDIEVKLLQLLLSKLKSSRTSPNLQQFRRTTV